MSGICRYFERILEQRDGFDCRVCRNPNKLIIHLITPRHGNNIDNMILLCKKCSDLASYYWKTNCRDWDEGKHPDDLYKLIKEK